MDILEQRDVRAGDHRLSRCRGKLVSAVRSIDDPRHIRAIQYSMNSNRKGFVLLEALVAVAIFAIGVIALGRCVSNCLAAERLRFEDARSRQVLENRLAE